MKKIDTKKFDPVSFIGEGWSIESDNGVNPKDLSKITLKTYLKEGESYIPTEEVLRRQGQDKPLNADAFLRLYENQELIPDSWKGNYAFFDGTVLRRSGGGRYFLVLYRVGGGRWGWGCRWLGPGRSAEGPSALLASESSDLGNSILPLGTQNLETRVQKLEEIISKMGEVLTTK